MTRRHGLRRRVQRAATSDASGFTLTEVLIVGVVVSMVLAMVAQLMVESDKVYRTQQQSFDARNNTAASIDMVARLIRQAVIFDPDPDGNSVLDSIRVISDWNPYDGDMLDPYEDVTFTVAGGTLFKQEPADLAPVPFAERINAITFTYFDVTNVLVASPQTANPRRLSRINLVVATTPLRNGWPGTTYASSVSIRRTE